MEKIRQFWVSVSSSLWFVPSLMLIGSIGSALFLIESESWVDQELLLKYPRIFGLGADGSRGMLTAIAGSMLTVAALAFSLVLSTIAQASGQYTPRILRNFMKDGGNQFILGYFVSVFAYSLVVLRTIRGADEIKFVPSLAIVFGLLLALGGNIVLIYFIHHVASSLQLTTIIKNIVEETQESIDVLFPQETGTAAKKKGRKAARELIDDEDWLEIESTSNGYIQYVDTTGLLEFAEEKNIIVKMHASIGQFVGKRQTLIKVSPDIGKSEMLFDEDDEGQVNSYFQIHRFRSIEQDVGYGIRQIVDIALKALSPGVNDTTTAIICIDYLGTIISDIAQRNLPTDIRKKNGDVRIIVKAPDFESFVETAFDQIRINGKGNQAVLQRLLDTMALIAKNILDESHQETLLEQVRLIENLGNNSLETDYEKEKVSERVEKTKKLIKSKKYV